MARTAALLLLASVSAGCATAPVVSAPDAPPPVQAVEPEPIEAGQKPPPGPYRPGFDVVHYALDVDLTGATATPPTMTGTATLDVAVTAPRQDTLALDFTGMRVLAVRTGGGMVALRPTGFRHADGLLHVPVPGDARSGDTLRVEVRYDGTPDDGMVIRDNVHGERSAFVDNWPNRARFWFPSIDSPSDKATVEYAVRVPAGWTVVSNGPRSDGADLDAPPADGIWRFAVDVPIPTYTMVVGAADFAIATVDACANGGNGCVPVTSWAFRPDSAHAVHVFRRAGEMVEFYSQLIDPFPYEKLANVQSATRFGGMENVGAIFYSERAIAQGRDIEGTVAHEVAHQWFGDAATEADWQHLWLSEGFASYFGPLFFEHADGVARFREMVRGAADAYLNSDDVDLPVVDTTGTLVPDLFALLNTNSYQKGAMILHMLRGMLGDDVFFDATRRYYRAHRHGTALTPDLQNAFETSAGTDLDWFFDQWVYSPGHPIVRVSHSHDAADGTVEITLEQIQKAGWPTFRLDVPVRIETGSGTVDATVEMRARTGRLSVPVPAAPTGITVDPDGWLLLEVQGQ